ncbi:MAG: thioesterase family protein [Bacteroidia bacterium]|nr:thioesterase family protein [Bacteroidia bacterium]MDW8302939.1 thioesterase family protein [Bacteroidia bacterium]
MARVKIDLPEHFLFECYFVIPITMINYGGHLGNDSVLAIAQEARIQFLAHYGYSEMNLCGVGIIMADAAIQYKSEGFHGNVLEVALQPLNFHSVGFDIVYKIYNQTTQKDLAYVKTGIVCFDYTKRKIVPLPSKIMQLWHS